MISETIELPSLVPGQHMQLLKHTFGAKSTGRSAYLQAGLHADEYPGLLVLHHLMALLTECERQGRLCGRVVIIPFANPVGLAQNILGCMAGRFNLSNGENFNRNFPDLQQMLNSQNSTYEKNNKRPLPREQIAALLQATRPVDSVGAMKHELLQEALQHDVVLDLHCDTAGILHLYSNLCHAARSKQLAGALGAEVVFVEEYAGGQPFDEAVLRCWQWFSQNGQIPPSAVPYSVTVELRGQVDVDDDLAMQDAAGLLKFLQAEGVVQAEMPMDIAVDNVSLYPLDGASHLVAPAQGIVVWRKKPGDAVKCGECIGEIVRVEAKPGNSRTPVISNVDGVIVVQPLIKYVRYGQRVALLAGSIRRSDRHSGHLLHHF